MRPFLFILPLVVLILLRLPCTFAADAQDTSFYKTSSQSGNIFGLFRHRRQFVDDLVADAPASSINSIAGQSDENLSNARRMMEAIRKGKPILIAEPEKAYYVGLGRSRSVRIGCQAVNAIQINFICNNKHVGPNEIKTIEVEDEKTGLRVMESYIIRTREMVEERLRLLRESSTTYSPSSSLEPPTNRAYWCQCLVWSLNANPETGQPDSIFSRRATIYQAYLKKKFEREPWSQQVAAGDSVTFTCSPPDALPLPVIQWFRNNIPFEDDGRRIVADPKLGQLSFFEVRMEDEANYTCVVENVAGRRSSQPALLSVIQNGGWSRWSAWSRCVADDSTNRLTGAGGECQVSGHKRRLRTCSRPAPRRGGKKCLGDEFETAPCTVPCSDLSASSSTKSSLAGNSQGWSAWSAWSGCSPAPECRRTRRRTCVLRDPSSMGCSGLNSQSISCAPSQCAPPRLAVTPDTTSVRNSETTGQSQWHPAEMALLVTIPLCGVLCIVLLALVGVWIKRRWVRRRQLNVVLASTDFVSGSRNLKFFSGSGSNSSCGVTSKNSSSTPFCYTSVPTGQSSASSSEGVPLRLTASGGSSGIVDEVSPRHMTTEVFMNGAYAKSRLASAAAVCVVPYGGTATYTSPALSSSPQNSKVPASEPLTRRSPPRNQPVVPNQQRKNKKYNQHETSLTVVPLIGGAASSSSAEVESPPSTSTSPGTASLNHQSHDSGNDYGNDSHEHDHRLFRMNLASGFVTPPPYAPPMSLSWPARQPLNAALPRGAADRMTWGRLSLQTDSELTLPQPVNARLFVPAAFCLLENGEAYVGALSNDSGEDNLPHLDRDSGQTFLSPFFEWGVVANQQTVIDGPKPAVLSFPHSAVNSTLASWDLELFFSPGHESSWRRLPVQSQDNNNINQDIRVHISANRIFVFTRQTGRFALAGTPVSRKTCENLRGCTLASKRLSFAAFVPRHVVCGNANEMPSEVNLLLYVLNDNGLDLAEAVKIEQELNSCLVQPETLYKEPNGTLEEGLPLLDFEHSDLPTKSDLTGKRDLSVEVGEVTSPWQVRGHSIQAIPHTHIWSATCRSLLHCSFTFSRNSRSHLPGTTALVCTLVVRQLNSTLVMKIDCSSASSSFNDLRLFQQQDDNLSEEILCRPQFGMIQSSCQNRTVPAPLHGRCL